MVGCVVVTVGALLWAVKAHWRQRAMVIPVFKIRVCTACGHPRDMLAFASTTSKRCMACTPLVQCGAPSAPGRVRLWRAQTARIRTEMKRAGHALPTGGAIALLGAPNADALWGIVCPRLTPGMTEDNYGEWHIDHACPVAAFDLALPDHRVRCFNAANMLPMWARANLAKGSALPQQTHGV